MFILAGGVTFSGIRTCTCLRKDITWDSSLFLRPRGIGLIFETTLQNEDKFVLRTEFGISGYTLDRVIFVVGFTRGVSS